MPFDSSPAFTLPAVETDEVLRDLIAARTLITDPANWCQGNAAQNAKGFPAAPLHDEAVRFCSWGAAARAAGAHSGDRFSAVKDALGVGFISFNDSHSHEEVLALFDRAIEARRAAIASRE